MAKYAAFGAHLLRIAAEVANVKSISGPGLSLDVEDVTSHDSTEAWEEVVATILRTGEISVDIVYDPNNATHKNAALGLLNDLTVTDERGLFDCIPNYPGGHLEFYRLRGRVRARRTGGWWIDRKCQSEDHRQANHCIESRDNA